MNAWTGKGILLAILASALPVDVSFLILAIAASAFGTMGLAIGAGVVRDPLRPRYRQDEDGQ